MQFEQNFLPHSFERITRHVKSKSRAFMIYGIELAEAGEMPESCRAQTFESPVRAFPFSPLGKIVFL